MKLSSLLLVVGLTVGGTACVTEEGDDTPSGDQVSERLNTNFEADGLVGAEDPLDTVSAMTVTIYCSDPTVRGTCAECPGGGKTPCCLYAWAVGAACEVCDHPPDDKGNNTCTTF
jgi:hypothetical protein